MNLLFYEVKTRHHVLQLYAVYAAGSLVLCRHMARTLQISSEPMLLSTSGRMCENAWNVHLNHMLHLTRSPVHVLFRRPPHKPKPTCWINAVQLLRCVSATNANISLSGGCRSNTWWSGLENLRFTIKFSADVYGAQRVNLLLLLLFPWCHLQVKIFTYIYFCNTFLTNSPSRQTIQNELHCQQFPVSQ